MSKMKNNKIPKRKIDFDLTHFGFFKIFSLFIFKTIITLGIGWFSAKNSLRKKILENFSLDGKRYEFTGSAREIFVGFTIPFISGVYCGFNEAYIMLLDPFEYQLNAALVYATAVAIIYLILGYSNIKWKYIILITIFSVLLASFVSFYAAKILISVFIALVIFRASKKDIILRNIYLVMFIFLTLINPFSLEFILSFTQYNSLPITRLAVISNRISEFLLNLCCLFAPFLYIRYIFARTSYNGIASKLEGSIFKYAFLSLLKILSILLLNIPTPYFDVKRQEYIWNNSYYGKNRYRLSIDWKPLIKVNIITTLLFIPTLGISRFWYQAALDRLVYNNLTLGDKVSFQSIVTGKKLAKLWGLNLLNILPFILAYFLVSYFAHYAIMYGLIMNVLLALLFSLPFIIKRIFSFYAENQYIIGDINRLDQAPIEKEIINDYS